MKRIYYNKLIRDKVPENIAKRGSRSKTLKLSSSRFKIELIKKVGEEASGLLRAKTKENIIAELADIIDVIEEIEKTWKISALEIVKCRNKNFLTKGGFKKRTFLIWSSDDGYKTNEIRYFKKR